MTDPTSRPHTSKEYDAELLKLHDRVVAMGQFVELQLNNALEALQSMDGRLAAKVTAAEKEVNRMQLEIDHMCTWLIAHRQPAARDLRQITATIKIINDLERIADEARNISRFAAEISLAAANNKVVQFSDAYQINDDIAKMLHDTVASLTASVPVQANIIKQYYDKIPNIYDANIRTIMSYMLEGGQNLNYAIDYLWVGNALEKIGMLSISICEHIDYLLTGNDLRHMSH